MKLTNIGCRNFPALVDKVEVVGEGEAKSTGDWKSLMFNVTEEDSPTDNIQGVFRRR